jgi:RNase P subunit RPR2
MVTYVVPKNVKCQKCETLLDSDFEIDSYSDNARMYRIKIDLQCTECGHYTSVNLVEGS